MREQALRGDVGGRGENLLVPRRLFRDFAPVLQRVVRPAHLHVRRHPEDAGAYFPLKSVHHREHRDQHHHPERHADDGNDGNERDVACALFGAGIAQADENFVRSQRGRR